jgi:hypothetical protein
VTAFLPESITKMLQTIFLLCVLYTIDAFVSFPSMLPAKKQNWPSIIGEEGPYKTWFANMELYGIPREAGQVPRLLKDPAIGSIGSYFEGSTDAMKMIQCYMMNIAEVRRMK